MTKLSYRTLSGTSTYLLTLVIGPNIDIEEFSKIFIALSHATGSHKTLYKVAVQFHDPYARYIFLRTRKMHRNFGGIQDYRSVNGYKGL